MTFVIGAPIPDSVRIRSVILSVPPGILDAVLTERLQLSPLTLDDLDEVYAIYSDPRTWAHLPQGRHESPDTTRAMIETTERKWQDHQAGYWAIRLAAPLAGTAGTAGLAAGRLIGTGGVTPLDTGAVAGTWNLGYRLDPASWGRGFATEIAIAALGFAARSQPDHPVLGRVMDNNPASSAVLTKVGLSLQWRGEFDAGAVLENPWLQGLGHCIYADRPLDAPLLDAVIKLH